MSIVCSSSSFSNIVIVWVSEIDFARNMNELKSSSSILGRNIPDFEAHDSKIANVLEKLLTADFKRRVYMEEQQAQQDKRFLKGRQIALNISTSTIY